MRRIQVSSTLRMQTCKHFGSTDLHDLSVISIAGLGLGRVGMLATKMCRRELVPPPSPHRCFFKNPMDSSVQWPEVEVDFTFWRCCCFKGGFCFGPKQRDIVDVSVIEHL